MTPDQASAESDPETSTDGRNQPGMVKRLRAKVWTRLSGSAVAAAAAAAVATAVWAVYHPQLTTWLPGIGQPGSPANVHVMSDPAVFEAGDPDWTGYTYVVPRPPGSMPPPPTGLCRDRRAWAYGLGGADAFSTIVMLEFRPHRAETVAINDVRIVIESAADPMGGTHAQCPIGGASAEPIGLLVVLDPQNPTWQYVTSPDEATRTLPITMTVDEVEHLIIEAWADDGSFEWHLELLMSDASGQQWVTVDDDGEPFRTTSTDNAEPRVWQDGDWIPSPR